MRSEFGQRGRGLIEIPKNSRETIRIERITYHGIECLNVRVWYENGEGEMRPSKKGLAIRIEQAGDLCQAILKVVANDT